jgi:hypothetical protein
VVLAFATYAASGFVARLHQTEGPPSQRVHIRWAPDVSPDERRDAEQDLGLVEGEQLEGRTWRYFVRKRSRDDIRRLISDRRVEDTDHIDRAALRVQIDRPELSPPLRALLESDRLDEVSVILTLAAIGFVWCARRLLGAIVSSIAASVAAVVIPAFDSRMERPSLSRRELATGIGMAALFLAPLIPYGPYELEFVQNSILSNQLFYSELFHGRWLYWFNNLGFGTPMPFGVLLVHPVLAPLVAFTSLRVTLTTVWLVQMTVMVVYFLRLLAAADIRLPGLRLLLTAFLVASGPTVYYIYQTDWMEYVIAWTLYPVLMFYLRAAILGEAREQFWRTALRLGLLFGFWVSNAHPGFIITSVLAMTVYTVVAAPWNRRVYLCLITAAAVCAAMTSARVYTLLREVRLYPATAATVRDSTSIRSYLSAFLSPLFPGEPRSPFLGIALGAAAVGALSWFPRTADRHLRGCTAAFVASAAFNVIPADTWSRILPGISPWTFRDPIVFFGLLAGGHVLQRAFQSPQRAYRYAAATLLLLQAVQQWYVLPRTLLWEPRQRADKLQFYRYQRHAVGLGRVLVDAARYGPRIYLSALVDKVMQGNLSSDGIHLSSDLVLLGLNPVNGWFKNVSVTVMQPPMALMESFISGDSNVINNPALLDVLGINLVLTTEHETGVPSGLQVVARPRVHDDRLSDLVLLANRDAWPKAVLLQRDADKMQLPIHPGCAHTGAMCRDYAPLVPLRLDDHVDLQTTNGKYVAHIPRSDQERLLFISAMYRPEWTATAASRALTVHPVGGAFLGVVVPPGVTDISVTFTPRIQIALTWFSNLILGAALVAVFLIRRRPRQLSIAGANPVDEPASAGTEGDDGRLRNRARTLSNGRSNRTYTNTPASTAKTNPQM